MSPESRVQTPPSHKLKVGPGEPGEVSSNLQISFCSSKNGYMGVSHSTWVLPDVTRYYSEKEVLGEMFGTAAV